MCWTNPLEQGPGHAAPSSRCEFAVASVADIERLARSKTQSSQSSLEDARFWLCNAHCTAKAQY